MHTRYGVMPTLDGVAARPTVFLEAENGGDMLLLEKLKKDLEGRHADFSYMAPDNYHRYGILFLPLISK